jgi:aminomethyltransferase
MTKTKEERMKKTPFYEVGLASGAQMVELFGYMLPSAYAAGHEAEHLATRNAVTLCDLDYMGEFMVKGPGAFDLVQKVATNDYRGRPVGAVRYTALCDKAGNMIDDGTIWRLGEDDFMIVTGDEADFEWIEENAAGLDVSVTNVTSEHTTLALQGPKSYAVLSRLTDLPLETIGYYRFVPAPVASVECIVARMGYTGEFGYELHFASEYGPRVWEAVMEAGADLGILPLGQEALESLRQEAGYLLVGNDHNKETNPLEAGIGFAVAFGKPEFNGRDALLEIARQGVRRRMVWFDVPGAFVPTGGDRVLSQGRQVGTVTSGSYSPTRRRGTAMGYVTPEHAVPGMSVVIEREGAVHPATLSVMPLYDPGDVVSRRQAKEEYAAIAT